MPTETQAGRHGYAQTNLQLYNQLLALGTAEADLERVHGAHDLAMQLFTAQYQPSGKPMLSHLIGTASILAAQRASTDVVAAGLLHAAYGHGIFPRFRSVATEGRRRHVRGQVGAAAEVLVERYAKLAWNPARVTGLREELASFDAIDRQVLLIRLANELEDHLDLGMHYSGEGAFHALYRGTGADVLVEVAMSLGHPELAGELEGTIRSANEAARPACLRRVEHRSIFVAPAAKPPPHST